MPDGCGLSWENCVDSCRQTSGVFRDSWRQIGTKLIKECTWAKFLCMRKYLGRF